MFDLLQKLTPKVLALLLAFSFLLLAIVTLFVSTQGGMVDLKNMVFKGHSTEIEQLKIAQHELARLKLELDRKPASTPVQPADPQVCPAPDEQPVSEVPNVLTMLCQLEGMIPRFGSSISTNLPPDNERKKAYLLIQSILQELGFYSGPINGEQGATHTAVNAFQKRSNADTKDPTQHIENFGSVGYKTLEAMRNRHRRSSVGA